MLAVAVVVAVARVVAAAPTVVLEHELTAVIEGKTMSQATSTTRCQGSRCLAARGAFGVFPPLEVLSDRKSDELWLIDPTKKRAAVADRFRPYDRLWFVDTALPLTLTQIDPGTRPRPPLADATTTLWTAHSDTVAIELWVRRFDDVDAALFAGELGLRVRDAAQLAALRKLPGFPIRVQHTVKAPAQPPVTTVLTLTALRREAAAPSFALPADRVDEGVLVIEAAAVDDDVPAVDVADHDAGWSAVATSPFPKIDAAFADDKGVFVCGDGRCVDPVAKRSRALPCDGDVVPADNGAFVGVSCGDFIVVVGNDGARTTKIRSRSESYNRVSYVVDNAGLVRALLTDPLRVLQETSTTTTKTWTLPYTIPAGGSEPDLGAGRVIAVTHGLGGKDEAAFFVVDGALVKRPIGGGGLFNGDCLWISEMKGGYTRLTPTKATSMAGELRGAAPPDGLFVSTHPWGDRGLVAVYERRLFLLDRDLQKVGSRPVRDSSFVAASPDGRRVYRADADGRVYVADVGDLVDKAGRCFEP